MRVAYAHGLDLCAGGTSGQCGSQDREGTRGQHLLGVPGAWSWVSLLLLLSPWALMKEVSTLILQTMRRLGEVSRHTGVTACKWHHSQVSTHAPYS